MANNFVRLESAHDVLEYAENKILAGANIAFADSAKESYRNFKELQPKLFNAFYEYINTGVNRLGKLSFTEEDFETVHNPFIPTQLSFLYSMLNHIYCYEVVTNKEIKKRTKELFQFIKGFEEVSQGLFIKKYLNCIYIVNCNTGEIFKRKVSRVKRVIVDKSNLSAKLEYWDKFIGVETVISNESRELNGFSIRATQIQKGYTKIETSDKITFRTHLVIMALTYGINVAKFLIGRNSFLTIDHIDENEQNNRIDNLRVVTRKSNKLMVKDKGHKAYNFIELFEAVKRENKYFYII